MEKIYIRIPEELLISILSDLRRQHQHAHERVGFCYGQSVQTVQGTWLVIINDYKPVKDENYIRANDVGARINSKAINEAFQFAYTNEMSLFHIHLHDFGSGVPGFSYDDMASGPEIIESMNSFVGSQVHGLIVLSKDNFNALALAPGKTNLIKVQQITSVGSKFNFSFPSAVAITDTSSERYSRQSFLGSHSERLFSSLKVGVVGLSGGGSHIVQQAAHIGFKKYVLSDPDIIDDESNLNRVVGATLEDAKKKSPKFDVFSRLILNLHPDAEVGGGKYKWQELMAELKMCDVIFGCLDTVLGRRDLENFCRRYLIPYIDIGMGIETVQQPYAMFGQVQHSVPGYPCLLCNGFITEETLKKEANNYGQKTKRPQVVWPNGILASSAIAIAIDLITNWTGTSNTPDYLSYNGNDHSIVDHLMKSYRPSVCSHYPLLESGPIAKIKAPAKAGA